MYPMLGDLTDATASLAQVCRQLATWHQRAVDGIDYDGEDADGDGATGTVLAAHALDDAAGKLTEAIYAIERAHSATSTIRWVTTTE